MYGLMSSCVLFSCFRRSIYLIYQLTLSREVSVSALSAMAYPRGGPLGGGSAEARLRTLEPHYLNLFG